ncbi:complement regulator-acquiring protein (plasmid) [Borreliella turdi]|uniref:complement regulator-acquiring protein n=1 Tax=Borreliella turdi TaxID=57863 RepID=UPI002649B3BA|nr:complement regulator-acquiring protein [Borreliella turdi]WKC78507.1 complement regulator-acquiring protein [Borreliella turdi]
MIKTKLKPIKTNIIKMILTLICISCAVNNIDPKRKNNTKQKGKKQNIEKKYQDLRHLTNDDQDIKYSAEDDQDIEYLTKDGLYLGYLETDNIEDINLKLETIPKKIEEEKEKEDTEIAKIADAGFDFIDSSLVEPFETLEEEEQMRLKRIFYSSLNYETDKINTLKEITGKITKNLKTRNTVIKFFFLTARRIQWLIEDIKSLQAKAKKDELRTPNKELAARLLIQLESRLKVKQKYKKILNNTIRAYNQDLGGIKTNKEKLLKHINENYKEFDYM